MDNVIKLSEYRNFSSNKDDYQNTDLTSKQIKKLENLRGLEVELIYKWEIGSMLIFDRTNLHCSSSKIEGKKIGLTTFTKR